MSGLSETDPGILTVSDDRVLVELKFVDDNFEYLEGSKIVKVGFFFVDPGRNLYWSQYLGFQHFHRQ